MSRYAGRSGSEAVDTLERLHDSGQYDRIVVVAHSLGTVVAYDMLRAYFSRVCDELPPVAELGSDFDDIDVRSMAAGGQAASDCGQEGATRRRRAAHVSRILPGGGSETAATRSGTYKSWLVTDFVTLGSALTHA